MSPHSNGLIGLAHRGFQMNDYDKHLVRFLKQNGFKTALSGIQHEAAQAGTIGYDRILHEEQQQQSEEGASESLHRDIKTSRLAAQYIKENQGNPYFLSIGLYNTHRHFPAPAEDMPSDYVQPPFPLYDNRSNREDMAGYMTSLRMADECVGMVLEALKQSGGWEDTLFIFTTDHGIAFPYMKCNMYDTGIGVSLIIKPPQFQDKGWATDALVSHIDLFPTICDYADLALPNWLEGVSLKAVLDGQREKVRDEIFAEVTYHAAYEPLRCVRTERFKLIRRFDDHNGPVPSNMDNGSSKDFLIAHGMLEWKHQKDMLFDLYLDPVERVNLAEDAAYSEVYKELDKKLVSWMEQTKDPLLQGRVPKPPGATVNALPCISAGEKIFE
jgi:arylsulfatase A-like enzyme